MFDSCSKCKKEGLHWKFSELTRKNILFENNDTPHICPMNPYDVNETVMKVATKYHNKLKFKIPIWCSVCDSYYKSHAVCGHILKTGFREGVDGIDYFSDREDMKLLRQQRQAELRKIEETRKKLAIGKFKPVDLIDFS